MEQYINMKNNLNDDKLKEPAQIIKKGGIVIFPTETVYGIGTNGLDENAIRKLYEVKQRPLNKPISLLVNNIEMVEKIAKNITEVEYKLMERFFPGPLTIILEKRDIVPDILTSNTNTIGIRMPSGEIAKKLIEFAGVPIATSSSNISGKPSGTNITDIKKDFEGKIDCFIDNGESELGIPSTVIRIIDNIPHILRQGTISEEEIRKFIAKIGKPMLLH